MIKVLEDIPMNDIYKQWIDEIAKMFGGLDIVAIEVLHADDNNEYIVEVNDIPGNFYILAEKQTYFFPHFVTNEKKRF